MTAIAYGTGAYRRDNGNLPELRLRNMFLESTTTGDNGVTLLSRRGLTRLFTAGTGPVRAMFSQNGVFNGDLFCVSGDSLYRGNTIVGNIHGSGDPASFAAGLPSELAVCAGGNLYRYDGTTFSAVTFPDGQYVSSIEFHDGLYFAAVRDTGKWYFSAVLDASTWDALSFFTAESKPDNLLDIRTIGDFLFLIGGETIERWANTGDTSAPYNRVEGSVITKGAMYTGCTVSLDNTLFFVGNDGVAYRLGDVPQRISDNGIEERIAASTTVSAFGFTEEGHSFFCIRLDDASFLYDIVTGQWCEFATYGQTNWRARSAALYGRETVFGDAIDGTVWKFGGWADDEALLERLFTAAFPLDGGTAVIDNLTVKANTGWTTLVAGQGSNPKVELRSSVDAGATWSKWRSALLGQQGKYRTKSQWRRLGMFDFPGGLFEIRITDPVPFRVSAVVVNEANGGRSR